MKWPSHQPCIEALTIIHQIAPSNFDMDKVYVYKYNTYTYKINHARCTKYIYSRCNQIIFMYMYIGEKWHERGASFEKKKGMNNIKENK